MKIKTGRKIEVGENLPSRYIQVSKFDPGEFVVVSLGGGGMTGTEVLPHFDKNYYELPEDIEIETPREFEEGAWYPIQPTANASIRVGRYANNIFYAPGFAFQKDSLYKIGEKLDVPEEL